MRSLLLALPLLAAVARPADACSPPRCWSGAFVPGNGATIPANAPGLYWRPSRSSVVMNPSQVQLTTLADPLNPIPFTPIAETTGDWVLVPNQALVAGTTYVLEETATCNEEPGVRIQFTAGPTAPLPTTLGTITSDPHAIRQDIELATTNGSCSSPTDAAVLGIGVAHAADTLPWKDLLLYETLVDGQMWSKQTALNAQTPPGQSWKGRGKDLLYRLCAENPAVFGAGLTAGEHQVVFRAGLPGAADKIGTPSSLFELMCDAPPDDDEPGDADDGGGCATNRPATLAFMLLALAMLVRARHRPR